ncbi:MAG TPA: pentapeptide repeat-containing protein [Methanothrix sp.]|nr:pentapeptide repeat-containing protein [Methanothrix sp.]
MKDLASGIIAFVLLASLGLSQGTSDHPDTVQIASILEKIEQGENINYDYVIIEGDWNKKETEINSSITIINSEVRGIIQLDKSIFRETVNFKGTKFIEGVSFKHSNFNSDVNFENTKFGNDVDFKNAQFDNDVDFSKALFKGDADFREAKFNGESSRFSKARFDDQLVTFLRAQFKGDAIFESAQFNSDKISLFEAKFESYADFRMTYFNNTALFSKSVFKGPVYFNGVQFNDDTSFVNSQFYSNVHFTEGALFKNYANFMDSQFNNNVYFEDVTFLGDLDLTRTRYNRIFLPWCSIDRHQLSVSNDDAYLAMIQNYMNLGWYEDSNYCYYEYRNKHRVSEQMSIEKVADTIEWALYGYGVKPFRTLGLSAVLILVFGLAFWQGKRDGEIIKKYVREDNFERKSIKSGATSKFERRTFFEEKALQIYDPFLFSLATFTSGITSFLHPSIEYELKKYSRLAILERLLGSVFIALLITAISKTYLIR